MYVFHKVNQTRYIARYLVAQLSFIARLKGVNRFAKSCDLDSFMQRRSDASDEYRVLSPCDITNLAISTSRITSASTWMSDLLSTSTYYAFGCTTALVSSGDQACHCYSCTSCFFLLIRHFYYDTTWEGDGRREVENRIHHFSNQNYTSDALQLVQYRDYQSSLK